VSATIHNAIARIDDLSASFQNNFSASWRGSGSLDISGTLNPPRWLPTHVPRTTVTDHIEMWTEYRAGDWDKESLYRRTTLSSEITTLLRFAVYEIATKS